MHEHEHDDEHESFTTIRRGRRRRPRHDDASDERVRPRDRRALPSAQAAEQEQTPPPAGDRWSTWDDGLRGPEPYPDWLVTELAAVDVEHGILKTGKEADVHLVERTVPGGERSCLIAAKRYRDSDHRQFHRDAGYLEGRRVRRSRENRAMARRTSFGREILAGQWAAAEFSALCRLRAAGVAVPYPVQLVGTEVLLEFVGEPDGTPAPRLAQLRPSGAELDALWEQVHEALVTMARAGVAHGDLSPFNILVDRGRVVLIDLPQIVDLVVNPQGASFLERDARVVAAWFAARGLDRVDPAEVVAGVRVEAGFA